MKTEDIKSFLQEGLKPTLEEILISREKRVVFIKKLLLLYPYSSVISFKLNIPGPVKNNDIIGEIFQEGVDYITSCIKNENWNCVYSKKMNLKTGPEYFQVICAPPMSVKEKMALIEENAVIGRLYDIDVLCLHYDNIRSITREEVGLKSRKCFICSNEAKICSSRRAHTVSEMCEAIEKLIMAQQHYLNTSKTNETYIKKIK